jgi:hypothetical protein
METIVPHHENNFPLMPRFVSGLKFIEHLGPQPLKQTGEDWHHLNFSGSHFDRDPLFRAVREEPLCIVRLPRFWHVLIHQRFGRSLRPDRDVALSFLDEAAIVKLWIRTMILGQTKEGLSSGNNKAAARVQERHQELSELVAANMPRLTNLEVMPFDMRELIISGVSKIGIDPSPIRASMPIDKI